MSEGLALHWRLIPSRYNLVGTRCSNCDTKFFPPRNLCPDCRRKGKIEEFCFGGDGEILSYTIVRAAPTGFDFMKPYGLAIIKLDEGDVMLTAQIVDCKIEDIKVGRKVRMVFRKIIADDEEGIIRYGYKFRLV
ncbi:Zn-ribbon domain-containing OB-fold protein [Candidatus Altiarchaeota archaeon]